MYSVYYNLRNFYLIAQTIERRKIRQEINF